MSEMIAPSVAETDSIAAEPMGLCPVCSLDCIRKGEKIEIISVDDQHARIQALRFGMAEGAFVECVTRVPAGPLLITSGPAGTLVTHSTNAPSAMPKRSA